jgi:2-methylcitrate dehydratase PrpD
MPAKTDARQSGSIAWQAADWAANLRWRDIPPEVVDNAKLRLLDVIGVLLAASRSQEAHHMLKAARELYGAGDYPIVGFRERCGLAGAALVNGAMSAILEFDDTHIETAIHPTSPVVAAALPYAGVHGATGEDLLRAVIVGSELVCRIGLIGPRFHSLLFHPTGIFGIFGAIYALANLMKLDLDTTTNAIGIAGSMAAGSMSSWDDGSDAKSLQPGLAAASGVRSLVLARNGLTGPHRIFESEFGFFRSHVQSASTPLRFDALNAELGKRWEALKISSKAYPSAFTIHPYIDAILELRADGLRHEDVVEITCLVAQIFIRDVCEPREDKIRPRTSWHARISLQHMLSEALVTGVMDRDSMTPAMLRDPTINRLSEKVVCVADPEPLDLKRSGGKIHVRLRDGREIHHQVRDMRGTPSNPIRQEDYFAKFRRNADGVITPAAIEDFIAEIMTIDRASDVGKVVVRMTP